jgi:2-iminobutanoate/2-iminopropanoate deaminase
MLMDKQAFGRARVPLSPALKVGNIIFVSGQVPVDANGDIIAGDVAAQTERVLDNIKELLEEAGASMADVVKTTVILTNVKRDFAAMNEVYARYFTDPKPSRTTLGAELAIDILVEIEAVAMVNS